MKLNFGNDRWVHFRAFRESKSVSEEREMKAFTVILNWCMWGFSPSGPAHLSSFLSTLPPLPYWLRCCSTDPHAFLRHHQYFHPMPLSKMFSLPRIHIIPLLSLSLRQFKVLTLVGSLLGLPLVHLQPLSDPMLFIYKFAWLTFSFSSLAWRSWWRPDGIPASHGMQRGASAC